MDVNLRDSRSVQKSIYLDVGLLSLNTFCIKLKLRETKHTHAQK